jgi:ribosomal protein L7Ae-like RNA K-turn-binding protein
MTFLLLRRLQPGIYMHTGIKYARAQLRARAKPLLLIICTDAFGQEMTEQLEDLRRLATECGVPVVHALTRGGLASACGTHHRHTVVSITGVPDAASQEMLKDIMQQAAAAYSDYLSLLASAARGVSFSELPPSAPPSAPPISPCALSMALLALRV